MHIGTLLGEINEKFTALTLGKNNLKSELMGLVKKGKGSQQSAGRSKLMNPSGKSWIMLDLITKYQHPLFLNKFELNEYFPAMHFSERYFPD